MTKRKPSLEIPQRRRMPRLPLMVREDTECQFDESSALLSMFHGDIQPQSGSRLLWRIQNTRPCQAVRRARYCMRGWSSGTDGGFDVESGRAWLGNGSILITPLATEKMVLCDSRLKEIEDQIQTAMWPNGPYEPWGEWAVEQDSQCMGLFNGKFQDAPRPTASSLPSSPFLVWTGAIQVQEGLSNMVPDWAPGQRTHVYLGLDLRTGMLVSRGYRTGCTTMDTQAVRFSRARLDMSVPSSQ